MAEFLAKHNWYHGKQSLRPPALFHRSAVCRNHGNSFSIDFLLIIPTDLFSNIKLLHDKFMSNNRVSKGSNCDFFVINFRNQLYKPRASQIKDYEGNVLLVSNQSVMD
uniref:hypothetical protein n=1 Tax=Salmonella sp. TaxID=599 RepID=UPI001CD967D4|nr:hypothetical protein [Salmonella sp.]